MLFYCQNQLSKPDGWILRNKNSYCGCVTMKTLALLQQKHSKAPQDPMVIMRSVWFEDIAFTDTTFNCGNMQRMS